MSGSPKAPAPSDQGVRDYVSRPGESFLVRAPAGAGKTQLLAERYVRLLAESDVTPEEIVCLTFTRKAAGEMRDRIRKLLNQAGDRTSAEDGKTGNGNRIRDLIGPGVVDLAEKFFAPMTRRQINVQTIDAFQRALVRADSFGSRVMPHFSAAEGSRYYNRAVARGMKWKRGTYDDLRNHFSGPNVHKKMVAMLRKRDQWMGRVSEEDRDDADRSVLGALWAIADGELDRIYSMEREYDYIAISIAAARLLGASSTPKKLEDALGYTIKHILVDEFQDLSASQCEFLKALASSWNRDGKRSFFAVGDSMQSIYRFRGAGTDVIFDLFEDQGDTAGGRTPQVRFGRQHLTVKQLTVNFRSTTAVVNGVYDLIKKVEDEIGKKESAGQRARRIRRGQARLYKAKPYRDGNASGRKGEFSVLQFPNGEREAAWVARQIECHRQSEQELAVLVRARSHYIDHIRPMLNDENDIDVGFTPLDRQASVRDLITLGRCVDDVSNEVACLALLRSPLIGMGSGDINRLYEWSTMRAKSEMDVVEYATPLEKILNEGVDRIRLASVGIGRFEDALREFCATVWRTRAEMHRYSFRERLERAWLRMGGGAVYCRKEDLV